MSRNVKPWAVIVLVLALVALAFGGGWFARGARPVPPPAVVHDTIPPPPPVVIKVPTIVHVSDTASARRVDSLVAASADKDRTLDSLAHALAREKTSEGRFKATDPTGINVSGVILTLCKPLDAEHVHTVKLDTITARRPVVYVPVEQEVLDWRLAVAIAAGGVAIGAVVIEAVRK